MAILLNKALPEFARELERLLRQAERADLAAQVAAASIVERCSCEDDFCSSFYTHPKPTGAYPPVHRTVSLDADQGMVNVDTVDDVVVQVEVLYRDDVRERLREYFP